MGRLTDADTDSTGKVRDVSEHMLNLNASDIPYTAMAPKKRKIFNSVPEWPYRTRPSAARTPVADGADVADGDLADYESLFGFLKGRAVQTRQGLGVGKRAQLLTRQYGRPRDKYKEYAKIAQEAIALGMEQINIGTNDSYTETVSSQPRDMTRGLWRWLEESTYAPIDLPINAAALCPAGNKIANRATVADYIESDVNSVMQSIAETMKKKKNNFVLFASPGLKKNISNWGYAQTQSATSLPLRRFTTDQSDKKLVLDITGYEGPFGMLAVHVHFDLPTGGTSYATTYAATADNGYGRTAAAQKMDAALAGAVRIDGLLVNFEYIDIFEVQNAQLSALPDGGGGPKGAVDAIWVHAPSNPQAHGSFSYRTA